MKADELPMRGLRDARLAIHAAASLPAWLWSTDGTRILWSNPVGARLFGSRETSFGPADPHRRQVAQLAGRLRTDGPLRLERLRGFGAPLGRLVTCGCTRFTLADGSEAVLIAAAEAMGRAMPLIERLRRLVEDADIPLAAFGRDGMFVGANQAAHAMRAFRNLSEAGLDGARDEALRTGEARTPIGLGHLVLQRVGSGADVGLIALIEPGAVPMPAATDDFPAPFTLFDEMSDFGEEEKSSPEPQDDASEADATWQEPPQHDIAPQDEPAHADDPPDQTLPPRTQPLRFLWEIDAGEHFRIGSDELLNLVGEHAGAALDAPWQDVASAYASYGRMAAAIASRAAWSGISLALPADSIDEPLIADLSGIPTYRDGEFSGYRGFGVVHDLEALTQLESVRRTGNGKSPMPQSLSAHSSHLPAEESDNAPHDADDDEHPYEGHLLITDAPVNVVPLRGSAEGWSPALTPVENNAFNELARELSARLEADHAADAARTLPETVSAVPSPLQTPPTDPDARALLDITPVPMAVSRDGRVLYANRAFVAAAGHDELSTLQAAPFDPSAIAHTRIVPLAWDGAPAHALIVEPPPTSPSTLSSDVVVAESLASEPAAANAEDLSAEDLNAEDLGAILDAADEAILMFDAQGSIRACNRSAARLFGVHGDALIAHDLASLFTPDTQVAITPLLDRVNASSQEQTVDARTIVGGKELPLKLTMGRARPDGPNFYAVVRDLTPLKAGEAALTQARRQTARATADKADILARISHEMRAPLSAIIGFADVMIEQRFGPLGSDRYADYLRDIRGCGERVVAIVDDLLDLSQIESGKRDLAPTPQDLNDLVEQCVAAMQPQANRERIIIRSSLAHPLPQIVADGAALRQITLNLIGNSIHLANPGGQVIVSTAHADSGDVLLRVRDTGHGLNDNEVATALSPFRPAEEDADAPALIRLSLTRALAEANDARFTVKPAPYAGTLIEVAFSTGISRS